MKRYGPEHRSSRFASCISVGLFPHTAETEGIRRQLARCGTSVAANYRAAGRCRTRSEFALKIRVVLEEADETVFWLETIDELHFFRPQRLQPLLKEANELTRIFSASLRTLQHPVPPDDRQFAGSPDRQLK